MRNRKNHLLLPLAATVLLAACSSPRHPAPIVDRTHRVESRPIAAVAAPAAPRQMDSHGNYTVRKGDTLFQIAQEFGQNFRDLVVWNNLANANDIQVDQLLRVTPPAGTSSVQSANVAGTASGPGIEVRPLNAPLPAPTVTAGAAVSNKTAPRGDKRPYSEATLAELQKPEGAATAPSIVPVQNEMRPAAPSPVTNTEDASVSWVWPAEGKIVSTFDEGKKGIDIAGKSGQPVLAAGAGKVMYAGSGIRGYGNLVIVKHTNNLLSAYAHNKTILVKEGQTVAKGEKIAEMGNTDADSVKLHFEIRQQGKPVDPAKFLPSQ